MDVSNVSLTGARLRLTITFMPSGIEPLQPWLSSRCCNKLNSVDSVRPSAVIVTVIAGLASATLAGSGNKGSPLVATSSSALVHSMRLVLRLVILLRLSLDTCISHCKRD